MCVQTHADYEHRLQQEVDARLLKEQELQHLVHPPSVSVILLFELCHTLCIGDELYHLTPLCYPYILLAHCKPLHFWSKLCICSNSVWVNMVRT